MVVVVAGDEFGFGAVPDGVVVFVAVAVVAAVMVDFGCSTHRIKTWFYFYGSTILRDGISVAA